MSRRELRRVEVMARVASNELKLVDAEKLLGLSYRQVKRLWRRYQEEGPRAPGVNRPTPTFGESSRPSSGLRVNHSRFTC